jgi:hypothetical protein
MARASHRATRRSITKPGGKKVVQVSPSAQADVGANPGFSPGRVFAVGTPGLMGSQPFGAGQSTTQDRVPPAKT